MDLQTKLKIVGHELFYLTFFISLLRIINKAGCSTLSILSAGLCGIIYFSLQRWPSFKHVKYR